MEGEGEGLNEEKGVNGRENEREVTERGKGKCKGWGKGG